MLSQGSSLMSLRAAGAVCAVVLLGGCMMQSQSAPDLVGPSGFGKTMTITATPDTLPRDGSSQSVITVNFRDGSTNQALPSQHLVLSASVGSLSVNEVMTDVAGNASFTYIAPSLNTPASKASVIVTPVGTNATENRAQSVAIALIGPDVPVASFTFSPTAPAFGAPVNFDGAGSTLNGAPCGSCSYAWDFGDGTSASGVLAQHTYATAGVLTATLTVTSPNGTSGTASKSLIVSAPAPPKASFTVTPSSPTAGANATFDASGSTVGAGASIVKYEWDFGDGNNASPATATTTHAYAAAGSYTVKLTVTDSLGRTAEITTTLVVM